VLYELQQPRSCASAFTRNPHAYAHLYAHAKHAHTRTHTHYVSFSLSHTHSLSDGHGKGVEYVEKKNRRGVGGGEKVGGKTVADVRPDFMEEEAPKKFVWKDLPKVELPVENDLLYVRRSAPGTCLVVNSTDTLSLSQHRGVRRRRASAQRRRAPTGSDQSNEDF